MRATSASKCTPGLPIARRLFARSKVGSFVRLSAGPDGFVTRVLRCCIQKMVNSFPCEEPEVLEALLRARKFRGSKLRTNVARGQPTEKHPSGRVMLKDAVLSDVVKSGRLVNAVKKHHPWVEQLTLNKKPLLHSSHRPQRGQQPDLLPGRL